MDMIVQEERVSDRLLRLFGNASEMSRKTGIGRTTINYWKVTGHVSSRWHRQILEGAHRHGIELSEADLIDAPSDEAAE